jgi:hypothetical protein
MYWVLTTFVINAQVISASRVLRSWADAKGHIVIPDTVIEIGMYAFSGNDSIVSVDIPPSVKTINYGAFLNCHALDSVNMGVNAKSFGQSVFENCSSLRSIKLPDSLYSLPPKMFSECSKLQRFVGGTLLSTIPSNVFVNCASLKEVVLDNAVSAIWDRAFASCPSLTTLILGNRSSRKKMVTVSVGENSFLKCPLQTIELNKNWTCSNSASSCFKDIVSLKVLTIGDSVTAMPNNAFSGCYNLDNLRIPKSVASIGKNAFFGCKAISAIQVDSANARFSSQEGVLFNKRQNILIMYPIGREGAYTLPATVDTVADYAFVGAKGLTDLLVPSSTKRINTYAFSKCTGLKTVRFLDETTSGNLPVSVDYMAFDSCSNIELISINRSFGTNQTTSPFRSLPKLDSVFIGRQANDLYDNFFTNCKALRTVVFGDETCMPGDSIAVGTNAFLGCTSLRSMYLNENIFSYNSNFTYLDSIRFGPMVRSIGSGTFNNCDHLKYIKLPGTITQLGSGAFSNCDSLVQITLTDSIKEIGNNCFGNCLSLKSFRLPASINTIAYEMFTGCKNLETIQLNDAVTEFGEGSFYNCSKLKNINWPKGLKKVGYSAFAGCRSLTTVELSNTVTTLEEEAFTNCSSLTNLTLSSGLSTILTNTFTNCTGLQKLILPNSITDLKDNSFLNCTGLKSIIVGENSGTTLNTNLTFEVYPFTGCDSVTYIEINRNIWDNPYSAPFISFKQLTDARINQGVTSLPSFVFEDCAKLKNLEILSSIQSIGHSAFAVCKSLEKVTLPKSVSSLSHYVFYQCSNIKHFWSLNPTPPSTGTDCFVGIPLTTCILHVPSGSKALYKAADQWKTFTNIEEFVVVGIDAEHKSDVNIFTDQNSIRITTQSSESVPFSIYGMDGRKVWEGTLTKSIQVNNLKPGFYLVRGSGIVREVQMH